MIDSYKFGEIIIKGEKFQNDIELDWDGDVKDWWREEGHFVSWEDVKGAFNKKPDYILIGAGTSERVRISSEVRERLEESSVDFLSGKTDLMVDKFNSLYKEEVKVIGLFHLTC